LVSPPSFPYSLSFDSCTSPAANLFKPKRGHLETMCLSMGVPMVTTDRNGIGAFFGTMMSKLQGSSGIRIISKSDKSEPQLIEELVVYVFHFLIRFFFKKKKPLLTNKQLTTSE